MISKIIEYLYNNIFEIHISNPTLDVSDKFNTRLFVGWGED